MLLADGGPPSLVAYLMVVVSPAYGGTVTASFRSFHWADIYLGSSLDGLTRYDGVSADEVRGATRAAFDNLSQCAINEKAISSSSIALTASRKTSVPGYTSLARWDAGTTLALPASFWRAITMLGLSLLGTSRAPQTCVSSAAAVPERTGLKGWASIFLDNASPLHQSLRITAPRESINQSRS